MQHKGYASKYKPNCMALFVKALKTNKNLFENICQVHICILCWRGEERRGQQQKKPKHRKVKELHSLYRSLLKLKRKYTFSPFDPAGPGCPGLPMAPCTTNTVLVNPS